MQNVAPRFEARIARLADHPLVGHTRAKGLIGAAELVADKASKRAFDPKMTVGAAAQANVQKHGVILRALGGDILAFCPPLIITEAEIDDMFDRVEKALDDTEAWVAKEDLRAA